MYRGVLRHPCFAIARAAGDFRQRKGKKPPARCLCTESAGGRPTRAREGARCSRASLFCKDGCSSSIAVGAGSGEAPV